MHRILLATVIAALAAAPAAAHDYVVDQECLPEINGAYSIQHGTPIGQEFVPTYFVMNVAEVRVVNGATSSSAPADLYAVVHADSITGTVLGTSVLESIPDGFSDILEFTFTTPIVLVPGARYVLEIRNFDEAANPMLLQGDEPGCPGIAAIFEGRRFAGGGDFWFRTGADAELPAHPSSWGAMKVRYR